VTSERDTLSPPEPATMISVLIGASEFPRKPDWSNPVLGTSARALRDYVLSPAGLALTPEQLLDLFDDDADPAGQLLRIADFLTAAHTARDLLLYYIGHGGFYGDDYHLGVRSTQRGREFFTTIESKKLAQIIRDEFHRKRVYVIFDSCFSASAASDWQGDEIGIAVRKMTQRLPIHGTAFLAAASKYDVTRAPRTERCTVFTGAVLTALTRGVDRAQPRLSIYELYEEVRDILRHRETREADCEGMPEIHVPSQRDGDVSLLPVFPNAAYSRAEARRAAVTDLETATAAAEQARSKAMEHARTADAARAQLRAAEFDAANAHDQANTRDIEVGEVRHRIKSAEAKATRARNEANARTQEALVARRKAEAAENAMVVARAEIGEAEHAAVLAHDKANERGRAVDAARARIVTADSEAAQADREAAERDRDVEQARVRLDAERTGVAFAESTASRTSDSHVERNRAVDATQTRVASAHSEVVQADSELAEHDRDVVQARVRLDATSTSEAFAENSVPRMSGAAVEQKATVDATRTSTFTEIIAHDGASLYEGRIQRSAQTSVGSPGGGSLATTTKAVDLTQTESSIASSRDFYRDKTAEEGTRITSIRKLPQVDEEMFRRWQHNESSINVRRYLMIIVEVIVVASLATIVASFSL
jgi:hypothetical protein